MQLPLMLEKEGLAEAVCDHLNLEKKKPNNTKWEEMIKNIRNIGDETVKIAIVGKYVRTRRLIFIGCRKLKTWWICK